MDTIEAMLLNYEPPKEPQAEPSIPSERTSRDSSVTTSTSASDYNAKFEDLTRALHTISKPNSPLHVSQAYDSSLTSFHDLELDDKIEILYTLMERVMESPSSEIGELCKQGDPDVKRYGAIGADSEGRSYWLIGKDRLYREAPLHSVKLEPPTLVNRPHTYELICRNLEEWRSFVADLSPKRKMAVLYSSELLDNLRAIGEFAVEILERRELAKQRKEEKLQRAALKAIALEHTPRKRSSRIELKNQEREERIKMEEIVESMEDIEDVRRFEALEQKRQERIVRENRIKEEVAILREKFQACIPSHRENVVKYNRTQPIEQTVTLAKNSSTSERVAKMKLWLSWLNPDESVTVSKREQSEMTLHGISDMKFSFTGDKTDIRSPILKNVIRVFLATVKGHRTVDILQDTKTLAYNEKDTCMTFDDIYGKLVLDEYDPHFGFEQMGGDIQHILETIRNNAHHAANEIGEFVTFFQELTFNTFAEHAPFLLDKTANSSVFQMPSTS
ncbi:hypothetical protein Unana1_06419 [Umbelopsis nana]